ncbi:hypothetical protein BDV38DRAFT_221621 [Aspergillus pseudotamarii]|uniref:Uncharacterized protein n=1 Tax=Aspergillus pseudotamarii TaxID=132259 RepID=A0A5N6T4C3_ASPPS|nr:uncharacterized protein BDV38DRAFT_221621 [Aspergillus pseudotamarii]KAE8141155.1 hypothetical protein BDV38DRAFT_221621 [Aspergillus pseudotamarii]
MTSNTISAGKAYVRLELILGGNLVCYFLIGVLLTEQSKIEFRVEQVSVLGLNDLSKYHRATSPLNLLWPSILPPIVLRVVLALVDHNLAILKVACNLRSHFN